MLPSADAILAGWPFLSRRFGIASVPNRAAIEAALRLAIDCADSSERDEPAALFYGFTRYPRAVPGAWRLLAERLARAHAGTLGFAIAADAEDLSTLRLDVAQRRADCEAVKAWFRARLAPM